MPAPQALDDGILGLVLQEVQELREEVRSLDQAIRGNGSPGLNQRVAALEDRLKLLAGAFVLGLPIAYDWLKRALGVH